MEDNTERTNDRALYTVLRTHNAHVTDAMKSDEELTQQVMSALQKQHNRHLFRKIAAVFIICALISGLTFAMWEILHLPQQQKSSDLTPALCEGSDSIVRFENTPLDSMLPVISQYYGFPVSFSDVRLKSLRLHTQWNKKRPLSFFIQQLNELDEIELLLRNDTLVVTFTDTGLIP